MYSGLAGMVRRMAWVEPLPFIVPFGFLLDP
jgi:hypothetical protein